MRVAVHLLAVSVSLVAAETPDAAGLVTRTLAKDNRNDEARRNYTYLQKSVERDYDSGGKVVKTETATAEILTLFGERFEKFIERNGKPIGADEEAKQRKKMDGITSERSKETPEQRSRRLAGVEHKRQRQRSLLKKIPEAFDLRITGSEGIGGRDTWVVAAEPKAAFKPRDMQSRILTKFRATFWIDKKEEQLVKLEAEALDTVSVGFVLARLSKGSRFLVETTRVNGEIWLPKRIEAKVDARLALLKKVRTEAEVTYSEYRKFRSESRIISASEPE